jgi:hypothetical protein
MTKTATRLVAPRAIVAKDAPGKAKAATKATADFVAARPDTRVPAVLMLLLYPLGLVPWLADWSPWLLTLFVPVAVAPTWLAVHRSYGDCWYTRIVTVTCGLVPVWLAVAAHVGVFSGRVLLGYCVGAVVLWGAYVRCEVLSERRARRAAQIDWAKFAPAVGLEGAGLRETTQTRLGLRYTIDIRGTTKLASQWVKSDLPETWAGQRAMPTEARVVVERDPKHTGQILVEERSQNPWKATNGHPTLDTASEWKLPARRSIHDGPLEVGADPSTGAMLSLPIYVNKSCQHVMVVATTGGGKTTVVNDSIERVTACVDTLVWAIDTTKGTLPGIWRDAIDWGAGVGETAKAMAILRAIKALIMERSRLSDGENHHATPQAPLIYLVVDESGSMAESMPYRLASEYKELQGFVDRSARSAGVSKVFISQRGVFQHTGTGDTRANASIRVCGRVTSETEMNYVIPDWQAAGAPNMATYAENHPGVVAIQAPGRRWEAGRAWDLSDFAAVRELARQRGAPKATLEPGVAALLGEPYAARRGVLVPAGGVGLAVPDVGWAAVEDDIDRELRVIMRESVEATERAAEELAAMRVPKGQEVPLPELLRLRAIEEATNRGHRVPDDVRDKVLAALTGAGAAGMSRAELVRLLAPRSESTVKRDLAAMRDVGMVSQRGRTSAARYVRAGESPGA